MPEFDYKPVQIYGKYINSPTAVSDGNTAVLSVDEYGRANTNLVRTSNGTTLFSGSVLSSTLTAVTSGSYDVKDYYTKTLFTYIGGSSGTLHIQFDPTDTGNTFLTHTSTDIPSGSLTLNTFTDSLSLMRTQIEISATAGTVSNYLKLQV